jgi:sphingomyelin phosphodiesterase 2
MRLTDMVKIRICVIGLLRRGTLRSSFGHQFNVAQLLSGYALNGLSNEQVGDFNCQQGSLAHKLITSHGLVSDSWLVAHPDRPPQSASSNYSLLSDADRIRLLGVTCDSKLNTWRAYDLAKDMDDPTAKRLDYVFVNQERAIVKDSTVVFTEHVPLLNCSYSDHFGIHVTLQLQEPRDHGKVIVSEEPTMSPQMFDTITWISDRYIKREMHHSWLRNTHFWVSLVVFVGLLIGQWWVKAAYGHFIILLCGTLVVVTGVVDGLIGFIFGRWEIAAIKEFTSEVELARKVYLGDQ